VYLNDQTGWFERSGIGREAALRTVHVA
jgi:hypothetical protein